MAGLWKKRTAKLIEESPNFVTSASGVGFENTPSTFEVVSSSTRCASAR
jgi:hypothetical protein